MPALKVNIIIVHSKGVVFPRALARKKTTSQGWTIMMFTLSACINCFILLKLYFFFASLLFRLINTKISANELPEWVPLGTPAVVILCILTSRTRFRSWSFYRYRKRFGDLDHCSPGHQEKTDDRWNRDNKEFRIY
jgi:hypothetical protein